MSARGLRAIPGPARRCVRACACWSGTRGGAAAGRGAAMAVEILFACALAAALLLGVRRWLAVRSAGAARLRRAELVYSERVFRVHEPEVISAKVDRAYRRGDGVFVLLELKTRVHARAYSSDVIELSAQRLALGGELGLPVAAHGYVLIQAPDGRQIGCQRVRLLP